MIQNKLDESIKSKTTNAAIEENENLDEQLINNPAQIFISFEWSSKEKAALLKEHLEKLNSFQIWFDNGQMGGGNVRNKRIDIGLRLCQVLICLITDESSKDETCLNQITLAVQLGKPIIPLLIDEKLRWPPVGSLGLILLTRIKINILKRILNFFFNFENQKVLF